MKYLHFDTKPLTDLYNLQLVKWLIARGYITSDKNAKILDLGSGLGRLYFSLKKLGYRNIQAADKFPQFKECLKADAGKKLPFKDNTFDVVISRDLAEHISEHIAFFGEQYRILKHGGKIVVMTPNVERLSMGEFYSTYTHVSPYTRDSLERALKVHHFTKVQVIRLRAIPKLWKYTIRAFDFLFSTRKNNLMGFGVKE